MILQMYNYAWQPHGIYFVIRTFFDSRKCHKGDMSNLPAIAYRLKDYGVLLKCSNDGIIYCDVSKHHHS